MVHRIYWSALLPRRRSRIPPNTPGVTRPVAPSGPWRNVPPGLDYPRQAFSLCLPAPMRYAGSVRRILTFFVLLTVAGAAGGQLLSSARAHCSMCGKACCCAPLKAGAGCRISRACDAETSSEAASSPQGDIRPAVLPISIVIPEPCENGCIHETPSSLPLSPSQDPPDRPPRLSL